MSGRNDTTGVATPESQELKKAGLKVTLPRTKILEMLEHTKTRHLSAEDVYKRLLESGDDIGLATVYRYETLIKFHSSNNRHMLIL